MFEKLTVQAQQDPEVAQMVKELENASPERAVRLRGRLNSLVAKMNQEQRNDLGRSLDPVVAKVLLLFRGNVVRITW